MYKANMTDNELLELSKKRSLPIEAIWNEYTQWKIDNGLKEAPPVLPSAKLKVQLGEENPEKEAVLAVIEKAMGLLEHKETIKMGSEIIIKAFDSLNGNKSSNVNVVTNNSTTVISKEESMKKFKELVLDELKSLEE
jgi:hypothetical protein